MVLVDGKSEKIFCMLENISNHGALICIMDPVGGIMQQGDIICLKTILLSPVEYQCKVTRIDSNRIAVQFLN